MALDPTIPRSRRTILAATAGGFAALLAHAFGGPRTVDATDGDPLVVGQENSATVATVLRNNSTNQPGFLVETQAASAIHGKASGGNGVEGEAGGVNAAGVWGSNPSGQGVAGMSISGSGVYGSSQAATGVYGFSASLDQPAILARGSSGGAGVFGFAGEGAPPAAPLDTGIYGLATGYSLRSPSQAVGVHGRATVGTGVRAQAGAGGTALRVDGKAVFSRSGVLTVRAGTSSRSLSVAGLTAGSHVFAVVRGGDGKAWVRKVRPGAGSFTVLLNKNASRATTVTWIAFG